MQLVARAVDDRGRRRPPSARARSATGPSSAAASTSTCAEVGRLVRDLALGVGARQQQQVGDQPAHALRRAQRATRPPRRARRRAPRPAARGWPARSSAACAARARRRRRTGAGGRAPPRVSAREDSSAWSISSERARQLGDLVLGVGDRHAAVRVARAAMSRAVRVSRRSAPARAAPATGQRQRQRRCRPARRTAGTQRTLVTVASSRTRRRAYWT